MNEQMLVALRSLPREKLEDLVIRAMTDLRLGRAESAANSHFLAMLLGFCVGTFVVASGFFVGAGLR